MSIQLLDKTRKINRLLHNNNFDKVNFNEMCNVLGNVLQSNVMVISRKGKILGHCVMPGIEEIDELLEHQVGRRIDSQLNDRMLGILSTKENVNMQTLGFVEDKTKRYKAIITPVDIAGERLGTTIAYRFEPQYEIDDIILSEYGATVVGLEMLRSVHEESGEQNRKESMAASAIKTLSYSEKCAMKVIMEKLGDEKEATLVASRIAQETSITRSVIVNALKKLESAGIIECRSAGMKGTKIKVLNDMIFAETYKVIEK